MLNYAFGAPKRHVLARNRVLWRFYVKVGAGILAVGDWKNPPKNEKIAETKGCAKSRMGRNETPYPIRIKFCTVVGIPDVITRTNFSYNRLKGFEVAGGQISTFPIGFHRRPYNTLALPCECVIIEWIYKFQYKNAKKLQYLCNCMTDLKEIWQANAEGVSEVHGSKKFQF